MYNYKICSTLYMCWPEEDGSPLLSLASSRFLPTCSLNFVGCFSLPLLPLACSLGVLKHCNTAFLAHCSWSTFQGQRSLSPLLLFRGTRHWYVARVFLITIGSTGLILFLQLSAPPCLPHTPISQHRPGVASRLCSTPSPPVRGPIWQHWHLLVRTDETRERIWKEEERQKREES